MRPRSDYWRNPDVVIIYPMRRRKPRRLLNWMCRHEAWIYPAGIAFALGVWVLIEIWD